MKYPSIFNDVLGPVMRGPSSSHSAAALRIGRMARDLMSGDIKDVLVEYDPSGSLVTTHKSQGSDMGLFGGFLGWDTDDPRLPEYEKYIFESGMNIKISYVSYGAEHPNTYKLTLTNDTERHTMTALSLGGGMIEVVNLDGAEVNMGGGYWESLVYLKSDFENTLNWLNLEFDFDDLALHKGDKTFIEIKSSKELSADVASQLEGLVADIQIKTMKPVLPVLSRKDLKVPFIYVEDMLSFGDGKFDSLWELALEYESARSGLEHIEIFSKMDSLVQILKSAVVEGLQGTEYEDRILPCQSVEFKKKKNDKTLIAGDVLNEVIMQVTSIMEVKSSMGVIVAAPTAGSCGALPGAILGAATALGKSDEEITKAMLAAGLIGVFISAHATFAAEEGGCMAECGSGSGMAAAGLVTMNGGTLQQALGAASMALQNSFGMICDPIGNRVEAPCLGKNVMSATNAISCANMALANYKHLIPLDEVISSMAEVGKAIPHELCCTALGGLSVTKTAKEIEAKLGGTGSMKFKSC
jgi:L-serine dehydratase